MKFAILCVEVSQTTRTDDVAAFRLWHEPDQPGRSGNVRCSGKTGSRVLGPSGQLLTQSSHFGLSHGGNSVLML